MYCIYLFTLHRLGCTCRSGRTRARPSHHKVHRNNFVTHQSTHIHIVFPDIPINRVTWQHSAMLYLQHPISLLPLSWRTNPRTPTPLLYVLQSPTPCHLVLPTLTSSFDMSRRQSLTPSEHMSCACKVCDNNRRRVTRLYNTLRERICENKVWPGPVFTRVTIVTSVVDISD
jgi:hypothetical protein